MLTSDLVAAVTEIERRHLEKLEGWSGTHSGDLPNLARESSPDGAQGRMAARSGMGSRRNRGRSLPEEPPRMKFHIRALGGTEAEHLDKEQARAIREVIEWVARRQSEPGWKTVA